jgi:hypothetical protein
VARVGELSRSTGRTSARTRGAIAARVVSAMVIGAALPLAGVVPSVQAAEPGAECQAVFPAWRGAFDRIEFPGTTPTSSHDSGNAVITYDDLAQGSSGTWSADTSVGQVVAVVVDSDPAATPVVSSLPALAGTWSTDASGVGPQLKAITLCYGLLPPATDTTGESAGPPAVGSLPFTDPQETEVATTPEQTGAPTVASTPLPATGGGGTPSQAPSEASGVTPTGVEIPSSVLATFKRNCVDESSTTSDVTVTFNPTPTMQLNEPTQFWLAVGPPGAPLPTKTLGGQVGQDTVTITCKISAKLVAAPADADVTPGEAKEETYLPPTPTTWVWEVTPRSSGTVHAHIELEPVVIVESGGSLAPLTLSTKQYPIEIAVQMTLIDRIKAFTDQANAILAALTVIVGIGTVLGVRKWRRFVTDRARKLEAVVGHDATPASAGVSTPSTASAVAAAGGERPSVQEPTPDTEEHGSHHHDSDKHAGHHDADKGSHHHDSDQHAGHHDPDKGSHHHDSDKHAGHHGHEQG